MNFIEGTKFKEVDKLQSGHFYWIHLLSRCYRINEVEHFLKDLETDLLIYLDNQGNCHHFNRLESNSSAITTIKEILEIPNLKEISFFEFDASSIDQLKSNDTLLSKKRDFASMMLKKVIEAYFEKKEEEQGVDYSIEELKQQNMKEYINPLDLSV